MLSRSQYHISAIKDSSWFMMVKRLHFHRRKFRIFGNFFFVKNSIECISHVDIYSLDNRFLLAVSWKLQDSLILSPITRDVVSIAPSSTATCIQRVLHPDVVVALESMSLLIGLKHIDTFSIIKNKRSKKKGERRKRQINSGQWQFKSIQFT